MKPRRPPLGARWPRLGGRRAARAALLGPVCTLAALLCPPAAGAVAASYHVASTAALQAAVASADSASGPSTIELSPGTYLPSATLAIKRDITISGPAAAPGAELNGSGVSPFPSDLLLVERHGRLTLRNVLVTGGGGEGTAAAIDDFGDADVEYSTLSGNIGPALWIEPEGQASVSDSTLSDGLAFALVDDGSASLINATVAENSLGGIENAGTLSLTNTIVAENKRADCAGRATRSDHSLASDGSCGVALSGVDPLLGALAANGGPTDTRSLGAGSPAIGAGDPAKCPSEDQRHFKRTSGSCDIGAYQSAAVARGRSGAGPGDGAGAGGGSAPGGTVLTGIRAHGTLRGRHRSRITFSLQAQVGHSGATLSYGDGERHLKLVKLSVSSVAFDSSRGIATIRGSAVEAAGRRRLRITLVLVDHGKERGLRIALSSGYYEGGSLLSGSINLIRRDAAS